MNFDSSIAPVWQLLVSEDGIVRSSAKYHCYVDNESLCGRSSQITAFYDDGISCTSAEVLDCLQFVCKRCLNKWKRQYHVEV